MNLMKLASVLLMASVIPPAAYAAELAKTKIVLIPTKLDHPPASHMYELECRLLAKCLNQTPGIEAVVSPDFDWPKDPLVLKDVRSIVYYSRPAGDILLDPSRRDEVRKLMKSGVGLACIHWATAAEKDKGEEWLQTLGGWFHFAHSGLAVEKQRLMQSAPDHPVCRGWKEYDLHDEFYLNLKFHEKAQPILKVTVAGKEQTVAWTLERADANGGRSFACTLGHFHDNFKIDAFRRMLVNGILWSARVEVPKDGVPVELTEDDLKLP
jgi:type 1 glutamine amidotransferase